MKDGILEVIVKWEVQYRVKSLFKVEKDCQNFSLIVKLLEPVKQGRSMRKSSACGSCR